ncbi:uncharacterized protein [Aegilops tauschii subsp. strangulata]|uniref:uncharacterized protein n=1 Tax=Aegilops tauschii subsp. strangulata TaxID=200361 RepID=UPI00098A6817|nr:L10-interacting MYB domain-containing protein-like [Aegilops tauschii subsp. strangulata]
MKAQWDNVGLRTFIDICVEEVNANNRGKEGTLSPLGYENVVRKFFERTRREYTKKQFKKKWDVLKKEYAIWKTLTQKASGIGFDPVTKTIAASDEWWANEIQRNELAAKFQFAPLEDEIKLSAIFDDISVTNEYARAAPPSSQVDASQIHIDDDDVAGSGCEIDATFVTPNKAKGRKKRSCPYSPSPAMVQKIAKDSDDRMQFKRIADLWEKRETSRNSATSEMKEDPVRDEIKEMKDMVVNDGGKPGSEVYFHALELFTKKEHRDVLSALKEEDSTVRLEWINRAWETFMKKI